MSKKLNILLVVLAVICFATGICAAQDQLAEIKNAGVLKFGVSADYYPFVYMEGLELDGLDIALVKEMGRRLGVAVEPVDMAFDGLIDAVMIGQVDLIGGGFSITEDRKEKVDFTKIKEISDVLLGCCYRVIGKMEERCTPDTVDGFIEDFRTLLTLKKEAFTLSFDFFGKERGNLP